MKENSRNRDSGNEDEMKENSRNRDGRGRFAEKLHEFLGYHRTGLELLKIVHKADSSAIPLRIIHSAVNVAGEFLGLYLTACLIDALLTGRFSEGFQYAGILLLTRLVAAVLGSLLSRLYAKSSQRCSVAFSVMMRERALSLDYETMEQPEVSDKIFTSERIADMYGGIGTVVNSYQSLLDSLLNVGVSAGLIFALCLSRPVTGEGALAFAAQPAVSFFVLVSILFMTTLLYVKVNARTVRNTKEYLEAHAGSERQLEYLLDKVMYNLQAAKVIRMYGMQGMLMENIQKQNETAEEFYGDMCRMETRQSMSLSRITSFCVVFNYLFVAVKVLVGAITIGAFTQYAGALTRLSEGFRGFVEHNAAVGRTCAYMRDFLELMRLKSSHVAGTIPVEKRLDGEYEIEFRDVSFRYPGSEEMILKHVNCRLTMKNKLALVGKNGAGKTTFIKLLCRLYEPTEGSITLNGVDIRKYREEEYRELFGVVFQDFRLFAFPLWQNVAAGYERDDEKLWDSLRRAGAEEFVRGLPGGADTVLSKEKEGGVDVSGGEAQKLALARALYKDAPFVVLDEPTAALDPISEAQVYAGFHEMVKDKTSIYISHRMSSCRFCDDIIVFDSGRIVERGSHEELLEKEGQYAGMWHAQAKYYVQERA